MSSPLNGAGDTFDYDLLVIGTGGAGTAAVIRASELGPTVAIVEGAEVVGGRIEPGTPVVFRNIPPGRQDYHPSHGA